MLFNSLQFLRFFPAFFALYWASKGRIRAWITLLGSYYFYACWDWRFLPLLWFSTAFDFVVAHRLQTRTGVRRRRLLVASLIVNLGLLAAFKYTGFLLTNVRALGASLGIDLSGLADADIPLPVGISFFTFQTMSYAIDVYRGEVEPERDPLNFAVSVALFVHLVAGPIVRARHLLPQLRTDRVFVADSAWRGLQLVTWGFFKKVVIADAMALLCDHYFRNPELHDGTTLLLGAYFYSAQIYCDFSGYTDIALGCANLLGYDLGKNFERPYFSASFSEFWTRWHISLSSWLRDYLYISLGGNRAGRFRTHRNLMITMLLGGLWHGANWTFVVWGALHGVYLIVQRVIGEQLDQSLSRFVPRAVRRFLAIVVVFHAVTLAWVFFRAPSFEIAWEYLTGIATRFVPSFGQVQSKFVVVKCIALCGVLLGTELLMETRILARLRERAPAFAYVGLAALVWAIALLGSFTGNTFIYFQF